jgi:hypothetical protein
MGGVELERYSRSRFPLPFPVEAAARLRELSANRLSTLIAHTSRLPTAGIPQKA